MLLAHRLIWICEAELSETEEAVDASAGAGVAKDRRGSVEKQRAIVRLAGDIKAAFGPRETHYFNLQIRFFESVTRISGVLKPLVDPHGDRARTKELRKMRIRSELEKIIVPSGSAPGSIVTPVSALVVSGRLRPLHPNQSRLRAGGGTR